MTDARNQTARIVTVNDTPFQLQVLRAILEKAGYRVDGFEGPEPALAAMSADNIPDLIITDLHMPDIDGWQFCRLCRSDLYPHLNAVPILANSAIFHGEDTQEISLAAGADAFLATPYKAADLLSHVKGLLAGKALKDQPVILIVDSDAAGADDLGGVFDAVDYRALVAYDAASARQLFAQFGPGTVLVDESLPDARGIDLIEEFCRANPKTVSVLLTSETDPTQAVAAMRQGASAFVRKPFSTEHLVELVGRAQREKSLRMIESLLEKRSQDLQKSEEKYRFLVENSSDVIWTMDADYRLTFISGSDEHMRGFTPDEVLGRSLWEFLTPEGIEHVRQANAKRLSDEAKGLKTGTIRYELQQRCKDGGLIWTEVSVTPRRSRTGELTGYHGVSRDVSERKKAEEALRESEKRHRDYITNTPYGVFVTDETGRYLQVNPSACRITGYSEDELLTMGIPDILPEEGLEAGLRHFQELVRSGRAQGEVMFRHKSGEIRWWSVLAVALSETRYIGFANDVTEKRNTRQQIDNLAEMLDSAPDSITIHDHSGKFLYANRRTFELHQYTRDEFMALPLQKLDTPQSAALIEQRVQQIMEKGEASFEVGHYRKDGSVLPLELTVRTILWQGVPALLSIGRDISERREYESLLRLQSLVLDQISDRVTVTDLEGIITYVNKAEEDILGYSSDELIGQPVSKYGEDPSRGAAQDTIIRETLENGHWRGDVVNYTKSGEEIFLDARTQLVRDENGKAVALCGISTDITERRRMELALREKTDLLQNISDHMFDLVSITDLACVFTYVGPSHRLLGFEPESFIGTSAFDYVHPDDLPTLMAEFAEAMANPTPETTRTVEYRQRCADGSYLWLETKGKILFADNGYPYALFFSSRDVTERRRTGAALAHSRDLMRYIIEHNRSAVAVHDRDLRYVYVSQKYLEEYGISGQDIVGKQHYEVFPDLPQKWRDVHQRALKGEVISAEEDPYEREDGTVDWTRWECRPWYESDGSIGGIIVYTEVITERKRAEDALRKSETDLANALKIAKLGHWELDIASGMFTFTDALYDILRTDARQMGGYRMSIEDYASRFVHPDDAAMVAEESRKAIETDDPNFSNYVEHRIVYADGNPGYINVRYYIQKDAQDKTIRTYGVNQDITERKLAEEALQTSRSALKQQNEMLNTLLDNLSSGVFMVEVPTGRPLIANPAAQRMLGRGILPDASKENLSEVYRARKSGSTTPYPPEEMPILRGMYGEVSHVDDMIVEHPDGKEVWLEVFGSPIHDENGHIWASLVSFQDITERKLAEEELTRRNAFIQMILDNLPIGLAVNYIDQGTATYMNRKFVEIYGWPEAELRDISSFFEKVYPDPAYRESLQRRIMDDILSGDPERMEWEGIEITRKSGAKGFIAAKNIPLLDQNLMISTVQDITERKEAEAEKAKLEAQLQQAMKMEAIGRLAGGVAHDFNNLLTGITGNVQLALMDLTPDNPLEELLTEVSQAADSAASLTRQLLAFSRKQLIEPKVLNLNDLIRSLHKMLSRLIGEDINLKTVPGKTLGSVRVDPGQFEQVLVNLAVNARDAMPDGGTLVIETKNVELSEEYCQDRPYMEPGNYVMLAVSDTGQGMTQEVKSRLFEPFFTTKPRGRGTGLGLATIFGIVKQSGGAIEVYSEPGEGTTFKIYLPLVGEAAEKLAKATRALELPGGTETVLVVEDEPTVRELAVRVLTRLGYNVIQAANGAQALAAAEEHTQPIDLLLTDVVMPGMNGRQLAERLEKTHPNMKVLYTSGYTENAIAHHGVIDEGLNFIAKPYTPHSLAVRVRDVLDT